MEKITYKNISSALNKKEMKNVLGGSGCDDGVTCDEILNFIMNNPEVLINDGAACRALSNTAVRLKCNFTINC